MSRTDHDLSILSGVPWILSSLDTILLYLVSRSVLSGTPYSSLLSRSGVRKLSVSLSILGFSGGSGVPCPGTDRGVGVEGSTSEGEETSVCPETRYDGGRCPGNVDDKGTGKLLRHGGDESPLRTCKSG